MFREYRIAHSNVGSDHIVTVTMITTLEAEKNGNSKTKDNAMMNDTKRYARTQTAIVWTEAGSNDIPVLIHETFMKNTLSLALLAAQEKV